VFSSRLEGTAGGEVQVLPPLAFAFPLSVAGLGRDVCVAILVVEDDPDLLDIICFAVRRDGHDVIAARDLLQYMPIPPSY